MSLIKKHRFFMAPSQYRNKSVLQRLVEELQMYHFADEYWKYSMAVFTDNLYITILGTVALNELYHVMIDHHILSQWLFSTNTGTNKDEHSFNDTHAFNLPIYTTDNTQRVAEVNIYAKPNQGPFPWTHIKRITVQDLDKPLYIGKTISMKRLDAKYGDHDVGRIHISCSSQITINKAAQIIASECGMNKDMSLFYHQYNSQKNDQQICAQYGTFTASSLEEKVDSANINNECGGGIIEIVSQSNIVNNGTLTCNASNPSNKQYLGGTIYIKTSKCFTNYGKIFAKPNGQIIIKCDKFIDNGTIEPKPIVMHATDADDTDTFSAIHPIIAELPNSEEIKLNVYHGHVRDKSDNVLDESNETSCWSVFGNTSGDWITSGTDHFEYKRNIRVVNSYRYGSIRCMALFVGSYKLNSKWIKLCKQLKQTTTIRKGESYRNIIKSLSDYLRL
eukprot:988478_1